MKCIYKNTINVYYNVFFIKNKQGQSDEYDEKHV